MLNKLEDLYKESIQTQISSHSLLPHIAQAAERIMQCLLRGNKIIVCGYGRSYANAQVLVANLLNRYDLKRPSFPSVLLSADSAINAAFIADQAFDKLYQQQFNAIAQTGDLLVAFIPDNNETNALNTVAHAVNKEINVIVLTGNTGDYLQGILTDEDIAINVPSNKESRILENHLFIANAICELIDHQLFAQV